MSFQLSRKIRDPAKVVQINWPVGSQDDPNSRIAPFKVHRGKKPYDIINKTLLIPHLFGKKDSDAYWANFDWKKALASGMQKVGLPFSGEFDWVQTSYVFTTTHMVAPKDVSLNCTECHDSNESCPANLTGFYMPGRDRMKAIDILGWLVVFGSLGGVVIHGFGRVFTNGKIRKKEN